MFEIIEIFPTPVYAGEVILPKYNFNSIDLLDQQGSLGGGFISKSQQILSSFEFSDLKNQIDMHINKYYYDILGFSKETHPYIISSWMTKHTPGDSAETHLHENSLLSGVVYLKVPENSGDLFFRLSSDSGKKLFSSTISPNIEIPTKYNAKHTQIKVKEGLLLIFPSQLLHSVAKNLSSEDRFVIAFNCFIKGKLGHVTNELNL